MNIARLCIAITCYRQPGLLHEAISSALHQGVNCNIVLVNDGCPFQETHEICVRTLTACRERVLYVRQRNLGAAGARNTAIRVALRAWPEMDALFFLDGDNRLGPSTLERLYKRMVQSGADWVFPDLTLLGHQGFAGTAGEYSVLEQILRNYVDTGSLVGRLVLEAGVRFDPAFPPGLEDWDFWLEAAGRGFRGTYCAASGFVYRRRPESLVQEALRDRPAIRSFLRRKHGGWITPRRWVQLEHTETPRYAVFLVDSDRVLLFTDPADRGRWVSKHAICARIAESAARKHFSKLPAFIAVTSLPLLDKLEKGKSLRGAFWSLEIEASRSGQLLQLDRLDSGQIAIRPAGDCRFESLAFSSTNVLSLPAAGWSEASTVRGLIQSPNNLHPVPELVSILMRIRELMASHSTGNIFSINTSHRLHTPIADGPASVFRFGPLFPIADARRRVGFLFESGHEDGIPDPVLHQAISACTYGYSVHLFRLIRKSNISSPRHCFIGDLSVVESLTTLTLGCREEVDGGILDSHLLGILGMMNLVVNHDCAEKLRLSGKLSRYGVDTIFSMCTPWNSEIALQTTRTSLQYEYAIKAFIVDSSAMSRALQAVGIPGSKVLSTIAQYMETL